MDTNVRETKRADELKPGDWLAPHELLADATEVLFVLAYPEAAGTTVYVVVRRQGSVTPYTDHLPADSTYDLATEADLAVLREQAERAQKIADIRALASWLEANPWAPMPNYYDANAHLDARHLGGPSETEAYAKVREVADRLGVQVEERLDDRTTVSKAFGPVTYQVIAWHQNGRPAEPEPVDPTGQLYSREADDPTPVSGARVEPHVGGMTEGGLVDETPERSAAIVDSNLRAMGSEGLSPLVQCFDGEPHSPHRTVFAPETGIENGWCPGLAADDYPGLIVGDTADEQRDNAYAAYERDEAECPSAWHVNQGDKRSRCPICNQAD